jgi:hypothetical protein
MKSHQDRHMINIFKWHALKQIDRKTDTQTEQTNKEAQKLAKSKVGKQIRLGM